MGATSCQYILTSIEKVTKELIGHRMRPDCRAHLIGLEVGTCLYRSPEGRLRKALIRLHVADREPSELSSTQDIGTEGNGCSWDDIRDLK